ncbi:polysaccharide deacetylase family protein [uncultured Draconibacterium sp.]|uniref:polysaccharide deacetylase family protein n=1 Tax=uncultured Draconibacterium sp. TaxID=1573823 RepID=UPI002AA84A83|nr:polysaccharide deacetylase family protein [uncultured Draconibacterium sp.]
MKLYLTAIILFFLIAHIPKNCNSQIRDSIYINHNFLFPDGKTKALIMSFDDGLQQDKQLIAIMDKYGIKGTFNLNSGMLDSTAYWLDDYLETQSSYIGKDEITTIYRNHEIASHSVSHPNLTQIESIEIIKEVNDDIDSLEEFSGQKIISFAYPFLSANSEVASLLENKTPITNARTGPGTGSFSLPDSLFLWYPTCHHSEAHKYVSAFKTSTDSLQLFYIWGHSWEFDQNIEYNNWDYMDKLCRNLAGLEEVWYTTTGEFAKYLQAIRSLKYSNSVIKNNSAIPVYLQLDDRMIKLPPYQK